MSDQAGSVPSSSYRRPGAALLCAIAGLLAAGLLLTVWRAVDVVPIAWAAALLRLVALSVPLAAASVLAIATCAREGFTRRVLLSGTWVDVVAGLAVGLLARAVIELVAPTTGSLLSGFADPSHATVAVIALGAVFVTPVVEEVLFRGVGVAALFDVFRRWGRRVAAVLAIVVSTAAFAALHLWPSGAGAGAVTVGALLASVLVGVGCGILFLATGRLRAPLIAHVVFNAIGVALLVW